MADSPTLINNEVEGNTSAVIDHGNNPFGTPGNPVWLNNTWNNHPVVVDGSENITSIGNLLNQGTISNASAHVLSINETGWRTIAPASNLNLGFVGGGGAVFGASLEDLDIIMAENASCKGFPEGHTAGDLVSCEGEHAGRLFLGGDLLLLNAGDDTNEGTLSIQSGVYQDGSGLKHQTVSTGNVGPGDTLQVTLQWKTAFGDANYQAVCSVADNSKFLQVINTSVPEPTQVIAVIKNNDASGAHTGSLACFAIHN